MNTPSRKLHQYASLLGALLLIGMMPTTYATTKASSAPPAAAAAAAPKAPAAPPAATPPSAPQASDSDDDSDSSDSSDDSGRHRHYHWHHRDRHVGVDFNNDDNSVFNLGGNSDLAAGEKADSVVSVMGSSTSAGEVSDSVVSVLGNSHVTGPVGDSVVSVLGNSYVDSKVEHDVVAVLGTITLGPHADIGGDLVAVGGTVHKDPSAVVHGSVQNVGVENRFNVVSPWFRHCVALGRPLAFVSGIGWAWTIAFVALALYLFAALIFGPAVEHCMQVLDKYPGQSLLTMILTIVATPIVFVILCITVVGIIAVPFLAIALFLAKFFGKLVMLAWIGRRVMRTQGPITTMHTASAVLVGGLLVMLLYCVPFIGIIVYYLLGLLGLGVVIYSLLLQIQGRRPTGPAAATPGSGAPQMASALHAEPVIGAAGAAAAAGVGDGAGTASAAEAPGAATSQPPPATPPPPAGGGVHSTRVSGAAAIALPRAGFWVRVLALLLDVILVGVVMHLLRASDDMYLIVLAAYGVVMWRLRGSTVGGIIFNLAVVKRDGHEMDWGTAVVRGLSAFLSLFALGLGFIWIAIDPENRSWHDKIAGTVVVRVP